MLPAASRLRSGRDFRAVARSGQRLRRGPLVVTMLERDAGVPRIGVVVGKKVGGAVQRNKVKRRLREIARARLAQLPEGTDIVLRALPEAGAASWEELTSAVERAFVVLTAPGNGDRGRDRRQPRPMVAAR